MRLNRKGQSINYAPQFSIPKYYEVRNRLVAWHNKRLNFDK